METTTRVATWENIGHEFTANTKTIGGLPEEMAFSIHKEPIMYSTGDGKFAPIKGWSTVVNDRTGRAYGPVSDKYAAVSNSDALGVLQYMDGMSLAKYGETYGGMQYVIGKLPEVNVLGDAFTPYLIFRNSFNGRYPIQVAICPLRIVCQNQLTMAFRHSENTFNVRHTANAPERLAEAQKILLGTADYMKELTKEAEELASIKMTKLEQFQVISQLFPMSDDMSERQKTTISNRLAQFQRAMAEDDLGNFKNTLWSLVQAYADYRTHLTPGRQTKQGAENQFINVCFDTRPLMKMIAIAKSVVAA